MATIEKRLIHLGNIPGTDTPYFHRYTIHTKDNGEQWVLRSGPSSNPSGGIGSIIIGDISGNVNDGFGTIDFTHEKYINSDGTLFLKSGNITPADSIVIINNNGEPKYDPRLHLTSGPIIEGNDQFVDQIVSQMVSKGNSIEGDNVPYSPIHQNSNTADAHGWEDALGDGYYDSAEYEVIPRTGSRSQTLIDEIIQNGGSVKDEDLFIPATTEDFEQNVNLATVAWDLVEDSANWLSNKIGKPLIDIIKESGGTVSDWMSEVAEQIGETSSSLFNSDKNFFSDLFDLEDDKFTAYEGDKIIQLANSGQITTDAVYVDSDGNPVSEYDALFTATDSDGNIFTIVKDNISVTLSNGAKALISSVIEMGEIATNATKEFMNGYLGQIDKLFNTAEGVAGLISDVAAGIQRGDSPEEIAKFIATKLAVKQLLDQGSAAIKQQIQEALVGNAADQAIIESGGDLSGLSSQGAEKIASLDVITSHPSFQFGYTVAITYASTLLLSADEGWDSEEYAIAAAQVTAQVAAQMTVAYLMPQGAAAASGAGGGLTAGAGSAAGAAYAGVGAAAAYLVSASITDLFADDNMNSHQWQSTAVSAAVIGVAAAIGFFAGGPIGAVIASVIVSQFMGGKEYEDGEYPDPYSFLHIEEKEDGTGQSIYGIEPEGVVAMTREHYHDDIYGTNGNDILVGRSGTNILAGRGGDDLLEGRGDTDQIYGGEGNDIIEAGNENDYVQGDEGNDLIYGDGGDDILIGGTGNDIIYGGIGDDRIEGNEDDDIIKGEDGNDTITAGTGNDNVEGGAGDDVIFGEDGDDEIDGGVGGDTIDGGEGIDILVGNDGNDNIKGGNGDDEIYGGKGVDILYGDSGSDIINGGEDNDLIFGGIGNDIVYGGTGDDSIYGEIGNDYVLGGEGNDTLDGFDGDDVLFAGKGTDVLDGGRGLDTFVFRSGDGQDTITDTDGENDVIKFTDINSSQVILTKDNNNLVITFVDTNGNPTTDQITITDQLLSDPIIETLEFTDGKKIDLTTLTTNLDNTTNHTTQDYYNVDTAIQSGLAQEYAEELDIDTRDQINTDSTWYDTNYKDHANQEIENEHYNEVQWRSFKKKRSSFGGHYTVWYKYYEENLQGTDGNDRLVGNWWAENLYGEGGDDQLYGNNGDDVIYGQDGNDYINGGADNDTIYGGNGHDMVEGGTGNDTIYGSNQNDSLFGGWGDDTIYGNNHDDFIDGGEGDDMISGDIDPQTLAELRQELENLKSIPNYISKHIGFGRLFSVIDPNAPTPQKIEAIEELVNNLESGNDIILGGTGSDTITGEEGNDLIIGGVGHDLLKGNDGNDTIYGRSGNDIINGNDGDDYISGGDGYDTISGDEGNDVLYGNGGLDIISGGAGNDFIYGGSGNDQLDGNGGNDLIYGGSGTNIIKGGAGNDTITGGEDYDKIEGGADNDTIFGRSGGDDLHGNDGNDIISAGQGNDILEDGKGSDNLIGGADNDIFIITKNDDNADIDTIEDFDASKDRIIIKVDYENPITFTHLQSKMSQNGSNTEINFDNGQQIIIKDTNVLDLTADNLAIGLAGGVNNDILFGTNNNDMLFGEAGDDIIYGQDGNDELWGGKGADILYGQEGNDTLRYEADDVFEEITQETYYDEIMVYWGYWPNYVHRNHHFSNREKTYYFKPTSGTQIANEDLTGNEDVFIQSNLLLNRSSDPHIRYTIDKATSRTVTEAIDWDSIVSHVQSTTTRGYFGESSLAREQIMNSYLYSFNWAIRGAFWLDRHSPANIDDTWAWGIQRVDNVGYLYNIATQFATKNFYNDEVVNINGYNRSFDSFDGGNGDDVLLMTQGDDMLSLDDQISDNPSEGEARIKDISVIYANDGNDIINLSSTKYNHSDTIIYGGDGDDRIWSSVGDDKLFGGSGNDEIYGGTGNDTISGGNGNDILVGGIGNDTIEGGSGNDEIFGSEGDDVIFGSVGADSLDGGEGEEENGDTISYSTSNSGVTVNIANNTVSGGDAEGDIISNFENITGSNFADNLTGDANSNIITGGQGDDILTGGGGSDTYIYNIGDGNDTITEGINNHGDKITLDSSIKKDDLIFESSEDGNDLIIKIKGNDKDSLIIKDQLANNGTVSRIEEISFANGADSSINLENKTIINDEDEVVEINLDDIEHSRILNQNITFILDEGGLATYDEDVGIITYTPDKDFNGIQELTYNITDEEGNIIKTNSINLLSSPINDNPDGIIENQETTVGIKFKYDIYTFIGSEEEAKQKAKDEKAIIVLRNIEGDEIKNKIYHLNDKNEAIELDPTLYDNKYLDLLEKLTTLNITVERSYRPMELGIKTNIFDNLLVEIGYNTQFSINLNDYIKDVDQDDLTYMVNVKNQIGLPHWLTLNEETGELSGIFGRDGKITLEVTASDGNGGIYQTTFDIKANVDLSGRVIDIPDLQITNGTDASDTLNSVNNQQDLISAGSGDDNINYAQDSIWQDTSFESFFAWNVYSGDLISVDGKLQTFDSFDGGTGNDTLNLTDGNDVLFLDDPVISALSNSARISGIEIINGGLGDDIIDLTSLNYEYGDVTLNGGDGDDILWSNSGDDILNGGDGNDNLQAGTGNDILNGDAGDDILKGYDGDETLTGGTGKDTLTGGFGFDSFNFTALNESTINQSDLITDFTQGEDSINFSNLGFTAIQLGEGSGTILGYTYDQENDITTIEDSNSDFAVQLTGKIDLVNTDFGF